MKVINEKNYRYIGREDGWFKFQSQPKPGFDEEVVLVKKALFCSKDGTKTLFAPDYCGKVKERA